MILDHIGIILKNERQLLGMKEFLGLKEIERGWVEEYQADCVMLQGNGVRIEAIFSKLGPLEKYNNGHGGIHHLAFELEPGEKLPEGIPMISEKPVLGICEMKVNFIPPILAGFPIEIIARVCPDD